MKLDRTITPGRGKYALIKLRESDITPEQVRAANSQAFQDRQKVFVNSKAIDFGNTPETDFFVIRLKDKYAETALRAYAHAATKDDPEYGAEILGLAALAANHKNKRMPD